MFIIRIVNKQWIIYLLCKGLIEMLLEIVRTFIQILHSKIEFYKKLNFFIWT